MTSTVERNLMEYTFYDGLLRIGNFIEWLKGMEVAVFFFKVPTLKRECCF